MRPGSKYLLLQIPGWVIAAVAAAALWKWGGLRPSLAIGLLALWVAKDLVLYPLLRSAYESDVATGAERLIGELGVARGDLAPSGYVLVRGELWRAEVVPEGDAVSAGTPVRVVAASRLKLVVEPSRE
jgi:membrane-bound serine protease (ClpP class)